MAHFPSELSDLPSKEIFPPEMPRYPNLWFYVDTRLALRGRYRKALQFLVMTLEERLGLRDSFVQGVQNHNLYHMLARPGEGSDFRARVGPIQCYENYDEPSRSHWHQLHARFYVSPLIEADCYRQSLVESGERNEFFLIPASVHYEVAADDELHPYADECPLCGITGRYDLPIDRATQDYCVKIHDPLGLEFLLHGTVRGKSVLSEEGNQVVSVSDLEDNFQCRIEEHELKEGEPCRLAKVYLAQKSE